MQNTLKIKRTKTALAFNLAIIACEIAAIIIVYYIDMIGFGIPLLNLKYFMVFICIKDK